MHALPHLAVLALLAVAPCGITAAQDHEPAVTHPSTWQPHLHPAALQRTIIAFTEPAAELILAPEVQGRLIALQPPEGERVTAAHTPAIRLDDQLGNLVEQQSVAEIAQAQAALSSAQAALALAARDAEYQAQEQARIAVLVANGRVTDVEGDAAIYQAERAQLVQAHHAAAVAQAERVVAVAQAASATAIEQRSRYQVQAPHGWTVAEHLVEPGSLAAPHTPVMRLVDLRQLHVAVLLDEAELDALRADSALAVHFPNAHGSPGSASVPASIGHVAVTMDQATRKRRVELIVDSTLAPAASGGLEAHLTLNVPDPDNGLFIPQRFLTTRWEQHLVTLDTGDEHQVVILRHHADGVIVAASSLPADCILMLAPNQAD